MNFIQLLEEAVAAASYYETAPWIIEERIPSAELIQDEIVGTGRWSIDNVAVYRHDGRFWEVSYAEPATENQESDKEEYSVREVRAVPTTVIKYVPITAR